MRTFRPGDYVIYRKRKQSLCPGRRAKHIYPAPQGDYYSYDVDKFWRIIAVEADRKIVACTRRGKQVTLVAEDPALRRLSWWERLLYWRRLPVNTSPGRAIDS